MSSPHDHFWVALHNPNPKLLNYLKLLLHILGYNFVKKGKGIAQLCVEASSLPLMATPLPLSVENATDPKCDKAIWVMFLFFPGS